MSPFSYSEMGELVLSALLLYNVIAGRGNIPPVMKRESEPIDRNNGNL